MYKGEELGAILSGLDIPSEKKERIDQLVKELSKIEREESESFFRVVRDRISSTVRVSYNLHSLCQFHYSRLEFKNIIDLLMSTAERGLDAHEEANRLTKDFDEKIKDETSVFHQLLKTGEKNKILLDNLENKYSIRLCHVDEKRLSGVWFNGFVASGNLYELDRDGDINIVHSSGTIITTPDELEAIVKSDEEFKNMINSGELKVISTGNFILQTVEDSKSKDLPNWVASTWILKADSLIDALDEMEELLIKLRS